MIQKQSKSQFNNHLALYAIIQIQLEIYNSPVRNKHNHHILTKVKKEQHFKHIKWVYSCVATYEELNGVNKKHVDESKWSN